MPTDIDNKILQRLIDKGLLQLDGLVESSVVEEAAIDRMMEEILMEERQQSSSSQEENIAISSEAPIDVFGRYQDLELLGEGGMAKVYKAYDPELKRSVALKFLRIEDARLKERLLREARTQAGIDHPNICKVYEVGELKGRPYIAMQYLGGMTLKEATRHLGLEEKVVLIKHVAESLQEAHRLGLIHRDIKPSNIMVEGNESGQWIPYLVDFGLARQIAEAGETLTDFIVGTPSYMSPEQAAGRVHSLDRRSDIYSLGVTFYELLSDQLPYKQSDSPMVQSVITEEAISLRKRNSSIPSDLETIVMKCLEKEPERRYESARGLADDLQRYLNGEPILARPVRLSYRLLKKAKKNKIAAAILSVSVLVTLALTGMLVWTEWRSRQQTKYANEFNQEVRYIESMMGSVYMAPAHDIRPELDNAKKRLKRLERRIQQLSKWAQNPGINALGQGYLIIRDYQKAQQYLKTAWENGFHQSATAHALGQVLGVLYQKQLYEADKIQNQQLRETRKREIEKAFRDPAVSFLKKAIDHVESPAYVEGLIAFYEKRYTEALAKAKEAKNNAGWSYEPMKLQGDIYLALGLEAHYGGDLEKAAQIYDIAGKMYNQGEEIARSEFEFYISDCEKWIRIMHIKEDLGASPTEALNAALHACDKAIFVNPDASEAYRKKSSAYHRQAQYLIYNSGEDPRPLLEKSIEFARKAVQRDPKDADGYRTIGSAYNRIGEYMLMHGGDPEPALRQAIVEFEKSIQLSPNNISAFNAAANAYLFLGEHLMAHGSDPRSVFQKSIAFYRKALQIDPRIVFVYQNMGVCYISLTEYDVRHGEDPQQAFQEGVRNFEEAMKRSPKYAYSYIGEGAIRNVMARYEFSRGQDPTATLRLAIKHSEKALQLNPSLIMAYRNLGNSHALIGEFNAQMGNSYDSHFQEAIKLYQKAIQIDPQELASFVKLGFSYALIGQYELQDQKNPTLSLSLARSALERAIQIDPTFFESHLVKGRTQILAARWRIQQGQDPSNLLIAAKAALSHSIELNNQVPDTYRYLAELHRWEAEWQRNRKQSAKVSIQAALSQLRKALSLNRQDAEALALQGTLYLLNATESQVFYDVDYRQLAVTSLEGALKMNQFLQREYEPILAKAHSLLRQNSSQSSRK